MCAKTSGAVESFIGVAITAGAMTLSRTPLVAPPYRQTWSRR